MAVKTRREAQAAAAPASATDRGGGYGATANGATSGSGSPPRANSNKKKSSNLKRNESHSVFHAHHLNTPSRVRVYVLTYFFSSLTIDKWRLLWGLIPIGWIFSSLAEWFGVPICHTNVQVQSVADPLEVAEFGFEGGPR